MKWCLTVGFHSPKVVPYSGCIVRAYRHRRIVERRQQIGPDIIDFCGGLPQRFNNIPDMPAVKLLETLLDSLRWQELPADPHSGGGAAYHVNNQFQETFHIIVGKFLLKLTIADVFFDNLSLLESIYPQFILGGLSGGDGWIRLDKISLDFLNITWVGFFDLLTWIFSTS